MKDKWAELGLDQTEERVGKGMHMCCDGRYRVITLIIPQRTNTLFLYNSDDNKQIQLTPI